MAIFGINLSLHAGKEYLQIEEEEADTENIANPLHHRFYDFKPMPSALKKAPITFQDLCTPCNPVNWQLGLAYLDDIAVSLQKLC